MELKLGGKRAVITGASKGIGSAIADAFAAEGADLVLVSRGRAELESRAQWLIERYGVQVDVIPADLSTQEGRGKVAEAVDQLDILVNNAGAIPAGALADISEEQWRTSWDLKVYGFIFLTQALYPRLAISRGVVLNIIGAASEWLPSDYIAGSVGNLGLVAFTKALAKSARRDGVRVVGINPGYIDTDRRTMMLQAKAAELLGDSERWPELNAQLPFGRAGLAEEIANAAAFLASPLSGYTSGSVLTIDGGGV